MRSLAVLAFVLILSAVPAMAATPVLSQVVPIPLHSCVNLVTAFTPDGRTGLIVLGWRDNGNAHGFDLATVMIRDKPHDPWNIARVEGKPGDQNDHGTDTIRDDPHTGDDIVRAFRFARGRLNDKPATFLLIASRIVAISIPGPAPVIFDVYALENDPEVGTTPDHFNMISEEKSARLYCNADVALSERFGLSFRGDAPASPNGC